ncbi:hypothetical protein LPJ66_005455 [Kickxella alabastrina]|uniref:Uncharacterized protein n=1 Tax=Kickxella alabastrina TaxID=61397 RepID=A0ACC1IGV8_9FUNG|nr:hypothetical protein LPJ66_005455 [Kickxella alabastrina]
MRAVYLAHALSYCLCALATVAAQDDVLSLAEKSSTKSSSDNSKSSDTSAVNKTIKIIDSQYDGVLLVGSKQTSCSVAMQTGVYGFVAANCIVDSSTNKTMDASSLGIALHGPDTSVLLTISRATVHPNFDAQTLANNVAVVQYESPIVTIIHSTSNSEANNISGYSINGTTSSESLGFMRRSLSSVESLTWNPLHMAKKSTSNIPEAICTTGSAIYAANADAMICSNSTVPALASDNPECSIPLGMAYRIVKSKSAAPAAIYSHTAVFGGDLCSYNEKAHYYTRLSNYIDWAAGVSGSQPAAAAAGVVKNVITADSTSFVMVPADPDALKINVYGGNLYSYISAPAADSNGAAGSVGPTKTVTVHTTSTIYIVGNPPASTGGVPTTESSASLSAVGSTILPTSASSTIDPIDSITTPPVSASSSGETSDTISGPGDSSEDSSSTETGGLDGLDSMGSTTSQSQSQSKSAGTSFISTLNTSSNTDDDEFGMGELSDDDSSSSSSLDDSAANNDQATAGSMSMGARIGIVVAVLLGIGAVGGAIWYYRKRKNTTRNYMN